MTDVPEGGCEDRRDKVGCDKRGLGGHGFAKDSRGETGCGEAWRDKRKAACTARQRCDLSLQSLGKVLYDVPTLSFCSVLYEAITDIKKLGLQTLLLFQYACKLSQIGRTDICNYLI